MKLELPKFFWNHYFFAIFLALKLTGYIDWSWWAVTAPLWLPFAILISFALA